MSKPFTTLHVRLTPRSTRDAINGWDLAANGAERLLRVHVSASPVDGKANRALIKLLSRSLRVPSRDIALKRGQRSRNKTLIIDGLAADEVERRLGGAADGPTETEQA